MTPRITVVGSINMDLVVRSPRFPRPGETLIGSGFQTFPGGKGANQAVAAARLGARVEMVGRVGSDAFGKQLREGLAREGIGIQGVGVDPDTPTGIAAITLDEAGQNTIIVALGANNRLRAEEVTQAWKALPSPDALLMPLEVPIACIVEAARLAQASGARIVLNPAPPPAEPLPPDLLRAVEVLTPNEFEAERLTGIAVDSIARAEEAANALLAMGPRAVVITLGERGALGLEAGGEPFHLTAHKVQAVDTVAAGDAFVAALTVALCEGAPLRDAARFANAAAAISVGRPGAQPSLPTRDEVDGF